jgi:probable rRNA maturation factor
MKRNSLADPWEEPSLEPTGARPPPLRCQRRARKKRVPTAVLRRAPRSPALAPRSVLRIADRMLEELGLQSAELSVLLTDDTRIHALNRQHRGKDRPTDVLAFPLDEDPGEGPRILGDVVISLDTAERQARGRKRALLAEVRFLLAHGLLHLLGYDHGNPTEKRSMDLMTRRLVQRSGALSKRTRK